MRNEVKIGILGVVSLLILIYGYKFLKGQNVFERSQTFYVQYADVDQLAPSNHVYVNGMQVGSVIDMQLDPTDPNLVLVTLDVQKSIKLPQETKAILFSEGLLGDRAIELVFNKMCNEDCLANRSYIPGYNKSLLGSVVGSDEELGDYVSGAMDGLDEEGKLKETIDELNTTVKNINSLTSRLDDLLANSSQSLQRTVLNVEGITYELNQGKESISGAIDNIETFSTNLSKADIKGLTENTKKVVGSADQAITSLESTLSSTNKSIQELSAVLSSVNKAEGTLGKLVKEDELHTRLLRLTKNLDFLLQDVRLNPKRYIDVSVFGKKQKDYELPENDPAFEK